MYKNPSDCWGFFVCAGGPCFSRVQVSSLLGSEKDIVESEGVIVRWNLKKARCG